MEQNKYSLLKQIGRKSTVNQIVDVILDEIIKKHWVPGAKIPTEFELAEMLTVSRNSVREAVKILEAMGILEVRRSEGTFIANKFSDRMLDPLVYSLILEQDKSKNLYELRQIIETGSIIIAAANRQPEELEQIVDALNDLVGKLRKTPPDVSEVLAADIHLHDLILMATHNLLLQRIYSSIINVTYSARIDTLERDFRREGGVDFLIQSHMDLVNAIIDQPSDVISNLVSRSLTNWKETLKEN